MSRFWGILVVLLAVAGCSRTAPDGAASLTGQTGSPGSSLAYEHTVSIALPAPEIAARMVAVREACVTGAFVECSLLRFEETTDERPSGKLVVRLAPAGVEPIVALAADGGVVGSHITRAEDLAEPVADLDRQLTQLQSQRSILDQFQSRDDLSVADMLALAREISSLETKLAEIAQGQAALGRRVETNLLTIRFDGTLDESGGARIRVALGESASSFIEGLEEAIRLAALGLPFVLIAFPVALAWRWTWRRATRTRPGDAG